MSEIIICEAGGHRAHFAPAYGCNVMYAPKSNVGDTENE